MYLSMYGMQNLTGKAATRRSSYLSQPITPSETCRDLISILSIWASVSSIICAGPLRNVVWSQSARAVQMLHLVGLIEQVVVVEVELYSPTIQWVQMMVVVVVEE